MKKWYTSKTLWANLIAIIAILVTGDELDAQTVGAILAVLNMVLRLITKENLIW